MATKKHKKKHKRNPPAVHHRKTHRRRFWHNPPMSMKGITSMLMSGITDAAEVVAGKAIVRTLPGMVGLVRLTPVELMAEAGVAVLAGYAAHSFISPNAGKMLLAGGLAAPLEDLIKSANVPFLSAALGEYPAGRLEAYPEQGAMGEAGAYPMVGAYPMGEMPMDEDAAYAFQQ